MADAKQPTTLRLDQAGLDAARTHLDDGAVTPAYGPWRDDVVALLNGALATELVCVLRYRRHHFMADGLESPSIAEEFMVHAGHFVIHNPHNDNPCPEMASSD